MLRRGLSLTLLLLLAVQLLGGVVLAPGCDEPCPDDADEASCPPVCATCTTCTHSRQGIVQSSAVTIPVSSALQTFASQQAIAASPLTADIFHVPLLG